MVRFINQKRKSSNNTKLMLGCDRMASKICGVYKITNMTNGKFYIGSSNNIKNR